MARIPEAEIERLKNEVSVERLVEASGIELKKSGKDLLGRCPFHEDDTASLVVTPTKNLWHCFGCGVGGGPIDWMIKKNGVSFRHAVELLKDGVSSLAAAEGAIKRSTVRALDAPVSFDADDQALLDQVVGYYHETLKQSPEALAYLQQRGLTHPELIEHFRLGVADRSLGLRLPNKQRKDGLAIRQRLTRIGVYRQSGHEHFNGSLIVPVLDEAGHVVEVYGRKIRDDLRPGTPKHLYLPACEARGRGVFNLAALMASKEIILCEALIDALTFWCAGYRNVTSAYGIEGFTDEMLAAFKRFSTSRVLIAYDRDEAGERGAAKVAERLLAAGIECFRIQFPKGMDANAYALKVTPAAKSLGIAIRKAVWLGKGAVPAPPQAMSVADDPLETPVPSESTGDAAPVSSLAAEADMPLPPASPVADALPVAEVDGERLTLYCGPRRWQVRGLPQTGGALKLQLRVGRRDDPLALYVDSIDLYSARARSQFAVQAAAELRVAEEVLRRELGRVLLACEEAVAVREREAAAALPAQPAMDDAAREAALALLESPDLTTRILSDFAACGLVGEDTNKLVGYLAAVSRKLDRPLGVVIQSSSAAGKSSLMDAVLAFVPEEEKVKYSAMTGQSLFYMGELSLKHKALAIVEEEGASRASYALKLLQSEGELTIASTGKDPTTGNLVTVPYRVEGPVALLFTTTARDLDEELMNRCLVLAVDEGREQTRAIHQLQRARRTLEGLIAKREREALITLHQNAQRLLRPLDVLNPYARYLTFPDQTTRLRRDHEKYLTLIDAIAYLFQHQRPIRTAERGGQTMEYIEASLADIALANRIAHDVLGRSLDELPPQTRRLLTLIDAHVAAECERQAVKRCEFRFSRRALREAIAWGDTQLKLHLARLAELEYLAVYRGKAGGFEYELVYEVAGAGDALRFPGLTDIEALRYAYDAARSGDNDARSGSGRPLVGPRSAGGRSESSPVEPHPMDVAGESADTERETHVYKGNGKSRSYPQPAALPLAAIAA